MHRGRRLEQVDRPGTTCANRQGASPPIRAAKKGGTNEKAASTVRCRLRLSSQWFKRLSNLVALYGRDGLYSQGWGWEGGVGRVLALPSLALIKNFGLQQNCAEIAGSTQFSIYQFSHCQPLRTLAVSASTLGLALRIG